MFMPQSLLSYDFLTDKISFAIREGKDRCLVNEQSENCPEESIFQLLTSSFVENQTDSSLANKEPNSSISSFKFLLVPTFQEGKKASQ